MSQPGRRLGNRRHLRLVRSHAGGDPLAARRNSSYQGGIWRGEKLMPDASWEPFSVLLDNYFTLDSRQSLGPDFSAIPMEPAEASDKPLN